MRNVRHFIAYLQLSRHLGSSSACSNLSREGRFMRKLMKGHRDHKSNIKWHNNNNNMGADFRSITEAKPVDKPLSTHTVRRMTVRNKLFMEHISDQISVGEVSDILSGNVEITNVKITADFKYVNVFYIQNDTGAIVSKEALQQCARIIRQQLSELRVIGVVPPIQFVENRQASFAKKVEEKLAAIDEDLKSWTPYSERELSALYADVINETSCNKIGTECTMLESKTEEPGTQLPVMKHDVLGLDHHRIMSQITTSLSKVKETSQKRLLDVQTNRNSNVDTDNTSSQPKEIPNFLTQEEQQKIFSNFLFQRRKEEKRRRHMRNLQQQKLLNNFEEDTETDHGEYEDDIDVCRSELDEEE